MMDFFNGWWAGWLLGILCAFVCDGLFWRDARIRAERLHGTMERLRSEYEKRLKESRGD